MWWLLNKIFGWDYVVWQNSCDGGVARVHRNYAGQVFYWRYKSIKCADNINLSTDVKMWLTCKPEKYLTATRDRE